MIGVSPQAAVRRAQRRPSLDLRRLLLAALAVTVVAAPAPVRADEVAYALVIGNNAAPRQEPDLRPLRFADDDAVRYYELFRRFAKRTVLLSVLDKTTQRRYPDHADSARLPTLVNLRAALAQLKTAIAADVGLGHKAVLYLAFSGHGSNSAAGEPYLALLDGELTQTLLYDEILTALPATLVHLLVDACNAGAVVGMRGAFDREISARTGELTDAETVALVRERSLARFPHVGAIIATSAGKEAHEWSRIESGVFTHELVSALLGAADVNGDRAIEYSEALAFVAAANSSVQDPRARPEVRAHPPRVNRRAPLLALGRLREVVVLRSARRIGRFHVELDNGQRYLDAHLGAGSTVALALPSGRAAFVRGKSWEIALPARTGGVVDVDRLARSQRQVGARGSHDAAYRRQLFATPYDATYYRGYVDSRKLVPVRFGALPAVAAASGPADGQRSRKWWSIGMFTLAGAAVLTSAVTFGLALSTRGELVDTDLQRRAHELADRQRALNLTAVSSLVVGALAAGAGWWLWPRASVAKVATSTTPLAGWPETRIEVSLGLDVTRRW